MRIAAALAFVTTLAAHEAARAGSDAIQAAAIETDRFTHAGEGSAGKRRVLRTGCYQTESRGSPGGGFDVHDAEAGCAAASAFSEMFAQVDALGAEGALVPEAPAAPGSSRGGRARGAGIGLVGDELQGARSVVIDARGRRLVPRDPEAAKKLAAIVNSEPSLDPWYVKPPSPPMGAGPQLVVLSAQKAVAKGTRRLQASLVATGAWWCHLSVPAETHETPLPPAPKPLAPAQAAAILGRVLAGISARALAEAEAKGDPMKDDSISVEAAVGAGPRTAVRKAADAAAGVAKRFGAEARALAASCRLP